MKNVWLALLGLVVTMALGTSSVEAAVPLRGNFTEYGAEDGMAHNNIHDIHIDQNGYVWLCTWNGVSRFDGYTFRNYCTDPKNMPVRHNRFRNVEEDGRGNLWFRTYDDHIYRFDPKREEFMDACRGVEQLLGKSYRVNKVVCSPKSDYVWIEYQGFGLICIHSNEHNNTVTYNFIDDVSLGKEFDHLLTDSFDRAWVALPSGELMVVDTESGQINCVDGQTHQGAIVAMIMADTTLYYATKQGIGAVSTTTLSEKWWFDFEKDTITTLAWDEQREVLYVGTHSKGLYGLTGEGHLEHYRKGALPKQVRDMTIDSHGTVWITTHSEGITRFDPERKDYKHFRQQQNTVQFYTGNNSVVIERGDRVWIKMNHVGFGYYDRQKDSVEPFYNDPTKGECRMSNGVAIFEVDENNVLWLSTYYERGLQRIVIQNQEENIFSLDNSNHADGSFLDEARALENDHQGNLWVGTKEGHLYCFDASMRLLHHITHLPSGRPLGPIYTIMEDSQGNLWVGTKGDGIYRLRPRTDGKGHHFVYFRHNPQDPHSLSNDQIYSIEEDWEGKIWVASYGGAINMLPRWDATKWVNTINSFPNYPTEPGERGRYLLCDNAYRMLLGTSEGLIIFDPTEEPESMEFVVAQRGFNDKESLQANDVIHILKDCNSEIWLSTYGGGVSRIEEYDLQGKPQMKTYTTADGLPSNIVMAATQTADGAIWFSTERGLSRLDKQEQTFTNYTRYDSFKPIAYSEAAALTDANGRVVVGCGGNQLQIIDPKWVVDELFDYNLHITSFEVQEEDAPRQHILPNELSQTKSIRLKHDYSMFRINFSALNFRLQERVNYMYRLEGYDTEWNIAGTSNSAYYSKVPHGHYTFRVKAYVGNPQMAGEEIALSIDIATPPWASWWAWTIYVAVTIAILWLIMFLYLRMAKLRTDARMEQDMTEMKLRFFTNISHELRTPLTLIIGGIEDVWRREELSERGSNSLSLSHKNAKRMLTLINQLLDFRKVVKNKMELRVERVDVVRLASEVIDNFRDSAAEKQIELLFSFSHNHIMLWCDPERIESLLYNLLSNALKFTKNGGSVTISVSQRSTDSNTIIKVSDTGIGIPRERLEGIFERFASYASAVRGEVSGSGIGLALCKEIVELHHGTISVESKPSQGTTFTTELLPGNSHFTMEQIVFGDSNPVEAQQASSKRLTAAPPSGARKIVLAEDNSEMRAFLYNNLIDNYEVVEATNGVEALEKIRSEQPDIVITDLMMPLMDGIELVEQIRDDFEISHLPVIMLTAKQTPEDQIMAMKYGADGYITKPFSMELLLARIDNLLAQRRRLFEKLSDNSVATNGNILIAPKEVVVTNRDEEFLKELMEWLEENIENSELSIDLLATHMRLGRTTLYNKIRSLTDKSPVELIKEYRLTKSELLLRTGQFSVSEVAYKVGFSDPSYYGRCFKEQFKTTPGEYLRKLGIRSK